MITPISSSAQVASIFGLAVVAAFNCWTRRINQFFFFSRTATPDFQTTPAARAITWDYTCGVLVGFAASISVFTGLAGMTPLSSYACFTFALIAEWLCGCLAFARAHRKAGQAIEQYNASQPVATDAQQPAQEKAIAVPLLDASTETKHAAPLLALSIVAAGAAWIVPMAAMHMGLDPFTAAIEANGGDFLSGLGTGLMVASVACYLFLRYLSRHRSTLARFTTRSCVLLAWIGAAAIAMSALTVPLHFVISHEMKNILLGIVLAVALLRMLYGQWRNKLFAPPQAERSGDQFWRWGQFYCNPSDPSLFVQHRCGPGYTVNFANFLSWPLTLAVLADFAFLVSIHFHR